MALVLRLPERRPRWLLAGIVALAAGYRLIAAGHAPQLSDDIFRYVWDGRVQAHGINPYLYAPAAPELAPLRDEIWARVNHRTQPTPYPPLSEAWFRLVYALRPDSVAAMQAAFAGLDLLVGLAVAWLLTRHGLPPERALIWLWSPSAVIHSGHSGHNDPLMLLPLVAGLALAAGASAHPAPPAGGADPIERPASGPRLADRVAVAGGVALGLAVLAKLLPLLFVPAWLRWFRWPGLVAVLAVVALGYLPYLSAGPALLGGIVTEGGESIFNDGPFWLIRQLMKPLGVDPVAGAKIVVAALLLGLALWLLVRPPRGDTAGSALLGRTYVLLGTYVATAAVVEPWYAAWLLPFVAASLRPGRCLGFAAGPTLGWLLFSGLVEVSDFTYADPDVPYLWTWVRLIEWAPLGLLAIWPWLARAGHLRQLLTRTAATVDADDARPVARP